MNDDCFQLLRAMAEIHLVLRDHASAMRKRDAVASVTHWSDLLPASDNGVLFQNYVSAEISDGRAIDWSVEFVIIPEEIRLEMAVEETSADVVKRTLYEAEYQYARASDCAADAVNLVRELCLRCTW